MIGVVNFRTTPWFATFFCFARIFLHSSSTLIRWKKLPFNKSPQIHGEKTLPTLKQHLPKSTENLNEDWSQLCNCAPVLASHQREAHEAIRLLTLGRRDNPKTRGWGCLVDFSKTASWSQSSGNIWMRPWFYVCFRVGVQFQLPCWICLFRCFWQTFSVYQSSVTTKNIQKPFRTVAIGNDFLQKCWKFSGGSECQTNSMVWW